MRVANWSKRSTASCGPGAASGWYWTLNAGRSSRRMPSTTPSLRLTWLTTASPNGVPKGFRAPAGTCAHSLRGGKAVVVAGDVDAAGGQVKHRLVHAAVPVPELVRRQSDRQAQDLAAEADAEDRHAGLEHAPHRHDRVSGGGRVARSVAEEHTVGAGGEDLPGGYRRRQHADLHASRRHVPRCAGLDAEIDG